MKDHLLDRINRVKVVLERRQSSKVALVYVDGSRRSMGVLEAVDKICRREDVVDGETVGFLRPGGVGRAVAARNNGHSDPPG